MTDTETKIKKLDEIINELNEIYQGWVEIFPFELDMFKHLKEKYKNDLPIIKNNEVLYYKDLNEFHINFYSPKTFFRYLSQLTMSILGSINTLSLYEDGKIDNIEKYKLEIILNNRKTEIRAQVSRTRYQKHEYIDYLLEWFEKEEIFIDKIAPFFKQTKEAHEIKKIPTKWYALLHIFKINAGFEIAFPLNENDQFDYKFIKQFAEDKYPVKNGQGFYRAFKEFYGVSEKVINNSFGSDYKEKLIELTEDKDLIRYIKS
ncbi:hypothetical protein [Saccharicrinis aurantiacus]|uniref:hypothetical protein n=1 Tax=Saccharicrinis aurantiacus TaxID=1849719 RepID=UPI0008384C77|nr:hypothetical protein [Saccharicrinis aurantiacus]